MCDDDVEIDPSFPSAVLARAKTAPGGLFFPKIDEHGRSYTPNGLDFLGFCTRPYADSEPYHTAHSQCFVLSREVTRTILFDEIVSLYGYEEFDFAYRVAAAGFAIVPVIECTCKHLEPNPNEPFRHGQDASRLWVSFKRHFFVDRKPLKGLAFAAIAVPHHVASSFKRAKFRGVVDAAKNVGLAASMLRRYVSDRKPSTVTG